MELKVEETSIEGLVILESNVFQDERGFFTENYHKQHFLDHGLSCEFVQENHSRSAYKVLRGFHYQDMSAPMGKLVRCTVGTIWDVAVDLRINSPTFGQCLGVELSADNMKQFMVPVGFGHAFVTLTYFAEVQYKCTGYYNSSSEGNIAWNDPALGVDWPFDDPILSDRDNNGNSLDDYLANPAFTYDSSSATGSS
jgi:dTDP-4-dehydrorhamnose 3,5-epimerase